MAVQLIERQKPQRKEITFEDYLRMEPTMLRHDIIDGVIMMSPAPTDNHQLDLLDLAEVLRIHVREHDLGIVMIAPMDLIIRKMPKLTTRQPDLAFFSWDSIGGKGRAALLTARQRGVAPDLAVEILSPGQSGAYLARKLRDYAVVGIPEVWLANRRAVSFEVLTLADDQYIRHGIYFAGQRINSTVLPRIVITPDGIFEA